MIVATNDMRDTHIPVIHHHAEVVGRVAVGALDDQVVELAVLEHRTAVHQILDHDLALIQTLVSEDGKVGVSTSFLHSSGERFDFGRLMVKAEGLTPQQVGGAITYLRRQSLQTACGIATDLDDDGAASSKPTAFSASSVGTSG